MPWPVGRVIAAVAIATAPAAGVSARPDAPSHQLDQLIEFGDPSLCQFTDATHRLLSGFTRHDPRGRLDPVTAQEEGTWVTPGYVPDHLRDRFGPITRVIEDNWWIIRTEVRGTLWGLTLTAIEEDFPGLDGGGFTFVFDAPLAAVEAAARARGLTARAGQTVPLGEPDGYAHDIVLEASEDDPRLSRLYCGYS